MLVLWRWVCTCTDVRVPWLVAAVLLLALPADSSAATQTLTATAVTAQGLSSRESGSTTAPQLLVDTAAAVAPANTSLPTISGTLRDGQTLTGSPGAWSGTTPINYAYQWQRCDVLTGICNPVAGATPATYPLNP